MALPLLTSESNRNGTNGHHAGPARPSWHGGTAPRTTQDFDAQSDPEAASHREIDILKDENHQLRELVAELERHLEDLTAHGGDPQAVAEQQKQWEAIVEEKTEHIRELHLKVQELELEMQGNAKAPKLPHEDELLRMQEELDRERKQLQEDEEAMTQQMRDMEIQMARERAEIARQRNDMQRLHNEIRHELELATRDAALRERLAPLQRRHQEVMNRRGSAPGVAPKPTAVPVAEPVMEAPVPRKESGLLRRLFR